MYCVVVEAVKKSTVGPPVTERALNWNRLIAKTLV